MKKYSVNISQIRELAGKYEAGKLQCCLQDALRRGSNECLVVPGKTDAVSILSMAGFVRSQMEQHNVPVTQALRILGQRMRGFTAASPGP